MGLLDTLRAMFLGPPKLPFDQEHSENPPPRTTTPTTGSAPKAITVIGPSRAITIGPTSKPEVVRLTVTPSQTIEPPARQAWDEKGWTKTAENGLIAYYGRYRVFDQRRNQWREFYGYVREYGKKTAVYIADPPPEVRRHPKGPCFMLVQAPWFYLNWWKGAKNVDDAILYMERLLWESLNVYTRR